MSQRSSMSESKESILQSSVYGTYLCTEPTGGVPLLIQNGPDDYTASMRTLQRSADYFAEKDQIRAVERLQWEMAKVHMQHEQWERAAQVLTPLWQALSWRKAGWWQLLDEVDWALRDCATRIRDLETLIAVNWELLGKPLTPRQGSNYNYSDILKPLEPLHLRPRSIVKAENVLSCISTTYAFGTSEGNVGVNLQSQLVITSKAQDSSENLTLSKIKVAYEGNLKNLVVQHEPSEASQPKSQSGTPDICRVLLGKALQDPSGIPSNPGTSIASRPLDHLTGLADLTIAPGATKVLLFDHVPRDAEDVDVASITLCLDESHFELDVIVTEDEQLHQDMFWVSSNEGVSEKPLKTGRSSAVRVLPKPPKLQIEIRNIVSTYYTNEVISTCIWVMNEEDEEANVTLEARVVGSEGMLPCLTWKSLHEHQEPEADNAIERIGVPKKDHSISRNIGILGGSLDQTHDISIKGIPEAAEYILEARVRYYLVSDPETFISKFKSVNLSIKAPFEVSYSFTPTINFEPWPSYFDIAGSDKNIDEDAGPEGEEANGLTQTWNLISRLYSLASESLLLENVDISVLGIHEETLCSITAGTADTSKLKVIPPTEIQEHHFILKAQKIDLEDRRSTFLDLRMQLSWRRKGSQDPLTVSHLTVPELVIPFGEPRVLATAKNGEIPAGVMHLDYVMENPSTYALSFNVTMEPSEEFAFSGPKNVSVELLPLSRHVARYNLMPLVKGSWISPQLKVYDTHFRKALKVNATEGIRSDEKGLSVWVDADG